MWSTHEKQTRSAWNTCWNVKQEWLCNRKLTRLLVSSNLFKLIGIDLSRQTNTSITQQINFRGTLEKEKQQKTISKFSLESLNLTEKYKQ